MKTYAFLALVLFAACGDDSGTSIPDSAPSADANGLDAAPPRETIEEMKPLQVGESVEGIMHAMSAQDLVTIHLEAPADSLSWNLHAHMNGGTQEIYTELNKSVVDYPFTPPSTGDWYLLLRNDGLTDINVKVKIGLYGAVTWSWQ